MHYTQPDVYEFIAKQTNDPIVERKTCRVSGTKFAIYQSDLDFYDKVSPTFETEKAVGEKLINSFPEYYSWTSAGLLKVKIPTPTLCPEERQRRRLLWRNERKLYRRTCDATNKNIISMYSEDKHCTVYTQSYWWSYQWDPLSFGFNFDKDKSFKEQFSLLTTETPRFSLFVTNSENCEYNNALVGSKGCYFCSGSRNEDSLYSWYINDCVKVCDGFMLFNCENCYQCSDCYDCRNCVNVQNSRQCNEVYDSSNCVGCEYCIGCHNLVNKKYYYDNTQVTKEEFDLLKEKRIKEQQTPSGNIVQATYQEECESCIGDQISSCKDSSFIFDCHGSKNIRYCAWFNDAENCRDNYSRGKNTQWCLENAGVGVNAYHNIGCFWSQSCVDVYYSSFCFDCNNCFGCTGLRNKSYCLFNKQYTKEERNAIVPYVIARMIHDGEWGEFLDPSLSPFGYNETIADEHYPLDKKTSIAQGFNRSDNDYTINIPENAPTIDPKDYKDRQRIALRNDDAITNKIIVCEETGKPFRIVHQELEFYRKHNLPLPKQHPDVRHVNRMRKRHGRDLYLRKCDRTGENIVSVYSKDSEFSVYSKEAYEKEIYS